MMTPDEGRAESSSSIVIMGSLFIHQYAVIPKKHVEYR